VKVLDQALAGLQKGARIPLRDMGLPLSETGGVLIVFWKDR